MQRSRPCPVWRGRRSDPVFQASWGFRRLGNCAIRLCKIADQAAARIAEPSGYQATASAQPCTTLSREQQPLRRPTIHTTRPKTPSQDENEHVHDAHHKSEPKQSPKLEALKPAHAPAMLARTASAQTRPWRPWPHGVTGPSQGAEFTPSHPAIMSTGASSSNLSPDWSTAEPGHG